MAADDLRLAIIKESKALGISAYDLTTAISFETGGTMDPWKKGPVTKWGEHRGLIQWGEPQRAKYGVYQGMSNEAQLAAVGNYLRDAGVKPGMGLMDIYSAINAGHVGLYNASDAANGGAPGTVADKVNGMGDHYKQAVAWLTGDKNIPGAGDYQPSGTPIFKNGNPYDGMRAPDPFTRNETLARANDRANNPTIPYDNVFQTAGASIQSDWASSWAVRQLGSAAVDPNWSLPATRFDELTKNVPNTYWDYVGNAHSEQDLQDRLKWAQEDAIRQSKLAAGGWSSAGVRLLTNIFDPTFLVATAVTEGAAGPTLGAIKATRIGRILAEAATAGTANALGEAATGVVNPTLDTGHIVQAFGLGAMLGGTIGALRRGPNTQAEANMLASMGKKIANSPLPPDASVGAAVNPESRGLLLTTNDLPTINDASVPKAAFGWARFDVGGQLGSSKNPISRLFSQFFGEEAVGNKDHSVVPDAATTVQRVIDQHYVGMWQTKAYPAFKKWAQDTGNWSPLRPMREKAWDDFNHLVGEHVETKSPDPNTHASVSQAAAAFREVMGEYADRLNNPLLDKGGTGRPIVDVKKDANYFAKYANHDAINSLIEKHGVARLQAFVKEAVFARTPDIKPEIADRIAKGWLNNIVNAGYGIEDGISRAITEGDKNLLRELLGSSSSISDDEMKYLFDTLDGIYAKGANEGEGAFKHAKHRTLLDYNYRNGDLSMRDFFINNADFVLRRYSRQTSGRLALAQIQVRDPKTGELLINGINSRSDFDRVIHWVQESWKLDPRQMTQKQREAGMNSDVENFKFLYDAITGTPHYNPKTAVYTWMRRLREFHFVRMMNRLGIAQSQEFSRMFGSLGVKAMVTQMPTLRRILNSAGQSVVKGDRLQQELEAALGRGLEMDFGHHRFRYEDALIGQQAYGRVGRGIDRALEIGKTYTADLSLMTHVHSIQQKWVSKAVSQRLYGFAKRTSDGNGGFDFAKLPGKELDKLRAIGMSDERLNQVFGAMLKHGESVKGSKLTALNMDKWDPETRAGFVNSMSRWADRIIHVNDAATLNRWMSAPAVQLMSQFRTFILGSWAKATLHMIHNFDARTFTTMLLEIMAGAASWALIQGAANSGKSDFTDLMAGKMTPSNLLAAGVGRAAFGSIVPGAIDTALSFTPWGPAFDFRSSGTPTDFLFGSVTGDFLTSMSRFTKGMTQVAAGQRELDQSIINSGARGLPFGNFLPFTALLGLITNDLPAHSRAAQ